MYDTGFALIFLFHSLKDAYDILSAATSAPVSAMFVLVVGHRTDQCNGLGFFDRKYGILILEKNH